ncbi:MAG TPA: hypothetical protein DDW30_06385 [Clostridiales bacterium]|nr:hypothetical protein [Clostridiales bacterium]
MLKVLLKKQLAEIFRSYFYNPKSNKRRSVGSTVGFFLLYVFLMLGICGGLFGFLAYSLCRPLVAAGLDWLYFTLLSLIAVALGTFGSVFNTYSGLYLAKDNDLLLSMPIPVRDIMLARLLGVYLMGLLYSGIVLLPAAMIYLIFAPVTALTVVGILLLILLISVVVLLLSCLLGWVVAKISLKLKNKSFITVLASLIFLAVYYFVYFKAQDAIMALVANAEAWGEKFRNAAYPLYLLGRVGAGDPLAMGIWTAAVAALTALLWWLMSRSFLRIATSSGNTAKAVYHEKAATVRSASSALLGKEFARFTKSPAYMLNCGLGLLFLVVAAVLLLVKGGGILAVLEEAGLSGLIDGMPLFLCAALGFIIGTIDITAPSVSLEGKNLWLAQSLPVTPWQVLRAKLSVQVILSAPPVLLCSVVGVVILRPSVLSAVLLLVLPQVSVLFQSMFGLVLNLHRPSLNWSNEIYPIKQSMSVFIALFGGWVIGLLPLAIYLPLGGILGADACLGIYLVLLLGACTGMLLWLKGRGARIFAEL